MTVYLEVDGAPVPARDCAWIEVAPCGCLAGVLVAQSRYDDSPVATTPEGARLHMCRSKVAAKRNEEEGSTFRLVTHEQFRAMPFAECGHAPQWGVARVTLPDGKVWATSDSWTGRKTHIKHIVDAAAIPRPGEKYPPIGAEALCGKAVKGWWHDDDHLLMDCVSCRKCEAAVTS